MNRKLRIFIWLLTAASAVAVMSCGSREPKETMTSGHVVIGASDAIYELAWMLSREFQIGNPSAFVDIVRLDNRSLVDSLINARAEEIFLDRTLLPAESLAIAQAFPALYTYPIAYYPVYLLTAAENETADIDSAALRGILTGQITNWKEVGGPDLVIRPYLPLPGEGAWEAVVGYFGGLDSVEAVICSTAADMIKLAEGDAGALLVYPLPCEELPYERLRFKKGPYKIPANAKTIMEDPLYPFRLNITYVTTRSKHDVAAGYLTFATSNLGQQRIMNRDYRPASVPVRVIYMK